MMLEFLGYVATSPELYAAFLSLIVIGSATAIGLAGLMKLAKSQDIVEAAFLLVIALVVGIVLILVTSSTRFSLELIGINLFRPYPISPAISLLAMIVGLLLGHLSMFAVNRLLGQRGVWVRLFALTTVILLFMSSAIAAIFIGPITSGKFFPPKYVDSYLNSPMPLSFKNNVRTANDFFLWKERLSSRIAQLLEFPTNSEALRRIREPGYEILAKFMIEDVEVTKIRYSAFDDDNVFAYLLRLVDGKGEARRPGLVVISGHPELGKAAQALIQDREDYQRAIALELAKDGYLVVVPELRTYGERAIASHDSYGNYLQMLGKPLVMLWVTEILQAANILRSLADVDKGRVGAVGISTGGLLAYLAGVFDQEIRAVVCASGLVSYLRVSAGSQGLHDQIPMLLKYADYPDVAALIAPRPLLISYGRNERGFYQYEAETLTSFDYVRQAYLLLQSEENLVLNLHDQVINGNRHTYDVHSVLSFLKKHLGS